MGADDVGRGPSQPYDLPKAHRRGPADDHGTLNGLATLMPLILASIRRPQQQRWRSPGMTSRPGERRRTTVTTPAALAGTGMACRPGSTRFHPATIPSALRAARTCLTWASEIERQRGDLIEDRVPITLLHHKPPLTLAGQRPQNNRRHASTSPFHQAAGQRWPDPRPHGNDQSAMTCLTKQALESRPSGDFRYRHSCPSSINSCCS